MASERLLTDPLILYLQKQAALDVADPTANGESQLSTNIADMKRHPPVPKLVGENPNPTQSLEAATGETYRYLADMFTNSDFRKKYTDKEH